MSKLLLLAWSNACTVKVMRESGVYTFKKLKLWSNDTDINNHYAGTVLYGKEGGKKNTIKLLFCFICYSQMAGTWLHISCSFWGMPQFCYCHLLLRWLPKVFTPYVMLMKCFNMATSISELITTVVHKGVIVVPHTCTSAQMLSNLKLF